MSLTKILSQKDANAEEQLEAVKVIVSSARKAYDNEDAVIEAPMCETTEGRMSFLHLEEAGQVQLLRKQVSLIKAAAVEFVETHPGSSMTKQIEERLATNAFFANVGNGTKFEYL
jgi:hypothetical protein